jgi:transcriptional regulator of acetoin/glycerol metabolism
MKLANSGPVGDLSRRRVNIENQWLRFTQGGKSALAEAVRVEIATSWQRSARHLGRSPEDRVPCEDAHLVKERWRESALQWATRGQCDSIMQLATEGALVAAIADPLGRLLWSFASRPMCDRAEAVNFIAGGCWNERAAGTNAVGLGLRLRRPVTVFSAEHFQPCVHDWVCYAAPIMDPRTGVCAGILDLSTTWDRHTPLGQAAVTELARGIALALPAGLPRAELEIHALGVPRVKFRGQPLPLSPRQVEILCLLALNTQGLTLDSLHAALYGDASVSPSTLKAELSRLRQILDGQIGARPYRLEAPFWADFIDIWGALRRRDLNDAMALYCGPFLPRSESPEIEEWRCCLDAAMSEVLEDCSNPSVLMERLGRCTAGSELVRERLVDMLSDSGSP